MKPRPTRTAFSSLSRTRGRTRSNANWGARKAETRVTLQQLYTRKGVQPEPMDLNEAAQEVVSLSLSDLVIRTAPDDADTVRFSVCDAGVGFTPRAAEKIFEPFHTTKRDGMGIGLSVSRSIIEAHRGRLWA